MVWRWILLCVDLVLVLWTHISRNLAQWTETISWTLLMTWTGYMTNPEEESSDRLNPEHELNERMGLITQNSVKMVAELHSSAAGSGCCRLVDPGDDGG